MPRCISCGAPTTVPGICTDCVTAKWYVAVLYYSFIVAIIIMLFSWLLLTVDNVVSFGTVKDFGTGQYFRNIIHIHDDSWVGEIKDHGNLYAYDDLKKPTDSILVKAGTRYEHGGYRKYNDSTMVVCMKVYNTIDETENWYLKVPEHWGWFGMLFSPKSDYVDHDVVRSLNKIIIDEFYADPRVTELVIQAKGKKEIKHYKADKTYKKIKAERSFDIFQKLLVPVVETIFIPNERRGDFILKDDYKTLKSIKKEYFDKDLFIERFLLPAS